MKFRLMSLLPLLLSLGSCQSPQTAAHVPLFSTQEEAEKHCPGGPVVWADSISGVYHLKGEAWYGRVFGKGAYVCKSEADKSPWMRHGHGIND